MTIILLHNSPEISIKNTLFMQPNHASYGFLSIENWPQLQGTL